KTDALISPKVKIAVEVPAAEGPKVSYPGAAIKASKQRERARRSADYPSGPAGPRVLESPGSTGVRQAPAHDGPAEADRPVPPHNQPAAGSPRRRGWRGARRRACDGRIRSDGGGRGHDPAEDDDDLARDLPKCAAWPRRGGVAFPARLDRNRLHRCFVRPNDL